jgi:hypothetical protein
MVSLGSSLPGILLGPNEILDISEDGISFETSSLVEVGEVRPLALQLQETDDSLMLSGRIVWAGPMRRKGVEFVELRAEQLQKIREWLFVSLLAACSGERGEAASPVVQDSGGQSEFQAAAPHPELDETGLSSGEVEAPALADYTASLAALEAVEREVESFHLDVDAALQLVADRVQSLTRSSGAAIALSGGDYLVCRASAGEAPGLGSVFSAGSGFSGACVRNAQVLYCSDAETDARVNAESCRALGVRSLLAAPVHCGERIAGLVELFSPVAGAFSEADQLVLRRVAEIVAEAVTHSQTRGDVIFQSAGPSPESAQRLGASVWKRGIAAAALSSLAIAVVFLLAPKLWHGPTDSGQPQVLSAHPEEAPAVPAGSQEDLRQRAEQGDATAQFSLGAHYALSTGSDQDYIQAAHWFTRAAEQGHVPAQSALGVYYASGTGVPKDLGQAYFWMSLARAGGDEPSRLRLPDLASRMTHNEIVSAQQRADEWIRQHHLTARN